MLQARISKGFLSECGQIAASRRGHELADVHCCPTTSLPQQHPRNLNFQPGQVLPPQFNHQRRPCPHLSDVIRQVLSMPPHLPPPPNSPSGPNGIHAPVLPRGPTIYGRTEGDLATANGPIPMIWSVDPPPATAPPHANVNVSASVKSVPARMAFPLRVQTMTKRPPKGISLAWSCWCESW